MQPADQFCEEVCQNVEGLKRDRALRLKTTDWIAAVAPHRYAYNFRWMGRPIIQFPQDMIAIQELIWRIRPDLIIETGIAHGGSLILSASMLGMLDYCDAITQGRTLDPKASRRRVLGIDIDIREHNRQAIESHPMSHMISMIQGSSTTTDIVAQVHKIAAGYETTMVILDSNHTHDHVLAELKAYAPLVSSASYCVVFDTLIEDMPRGSFADRPWDIGNNPKTAVAEFLSLTDHFVVDEDIEAKLMITVAPSGYLRRR